MCEEYSRNPVVLGKSRPLQGLESEEKQIRPQLLDFPNNCLHSLSLFFDVDPVRKGPYSSSLATATEFK